MSDLIKKYNFSENDLYILSVIEIKKKKSSYLEKEKLKAKSMGVLKPYNVSFMDLGGLIDEISSNSDYNSRKALIDKYGEVDFTTLKNSSGLSTKTIISIVIGFVILFGIINSDTTTENRPSYDSDSYDSYEENTSGWTTCGFCNIDFPLSSLDYGGGNYCSYDCCVGGGKCSGYYK
jgi:hypothetical protein